MHRKRVFRLICTTHATVLDPSALDDDQVVVVYYLQLSEKRNRSQLSPHYSAKEKISIQRLRDFAKLVSKEKWFAVQQFNYEFSLLGLRCGIFDWTRIARTSNVETTLGCHDLNQPYQKGGIVVGSRGYRIHQGNSLNRPTDLQLSDEDIFYLDDDGIAEEELTRRNGNEWQMNLLRRYCGLYDEKPMIVCLHNVTRCKSLTTARTWTM
jgi:hypothetical protein